MTRLLQVGFLAASLALVGCGNKHKDLDTVVKQDLKIEKPGWKGSKDPGTRGQYTVTVEVNNPTAKDFELNSVKVEVTAKGKDACSEKVKVGEWVAADGGGVAVTIEVPCMFQDVAPESEVTAIVNMTTYKGDSVQARKKRSAIQMR